MHALRLQGDQLDQAAAGLGMDARRRHRSYSATLPAFTQSIPVLPEIACALLSQIEDGRC